MQPAPALAFYIVNFRRPLYQMGRWEDSCIEDNMKATLILLATLVTAGFAFNAEAATTTATATARILPRPEQVRINPSSIRTDGSYTAGEMTFSRTAASVEVSSDAVGNEAGGAPGQVAARHVVLHNN